jgi:2-hydroxy-6-oxonona-2,4-dienedioate hydrolase
VTARDAELHGVELHGVELHGVELHGVELRGVELRGVELRGVELHGTELHGTELHDTWDVVNGIRVHGLASVPDAVTLDRTPADGLPLVFVHGLGVSTRYLAPTMALLARQHPELAVAGLDLPGFGRSATPTHALDVPELADALAGWLDVRGIGPATFVGNSHGCQVIVELATRMPARVLGLVLNAPTMDPAHRTVLGQMTRVLLDIPREPLSLAVIVLRDYLRAGPIRLWRTLRSALADHIEEKLPMLAMPVAIVCGALDPVVTVPWSTEAARLTGISRPHAAGATLHVVPSASHALPFDDPASFAPLIVALVERVRRPAATTREGEGSSE